MSERETPAQPLDWEYLAHSEIGLVRKNNQDSGLVSARLLMVADGMGGAAAGDLASAVAVDTIAQVGRNSGEQKPEGADKLHRLSSAISAANTRIADLVATDYTLEGMGTTVTGAVLDGNNVGLAHIGDSRGYLFRAGNLSQLTHDHSWVQSLIDDGKITEEEATTHPHRSLLLKVLNGQPANEPDLSTVPVRAGDRLLLCSDGLCGFVEDDVIANALTDTSRDDAMDRLVSAAHQAGGLDNITIIIADLVETQPATAATDAEATDTDTETTDAEATGTVAAVTGSDHDQSNESTHRVSGPIDSPQIIGAAAERDIAAYVEEIRDRVAQREADSDDNDADDDDDDEGPDDEDRYDPQPPSKRRWRRPLLLILAVVLIIAAAGGAGLAWIRTQYYVGSASQNVAIYQGLNQSVLGVQLSRVYEVQDLPLDDLPPYYQGLVTETIDTGTLDSAHATVQQLRDTADRCAAEQQTPSDPTSTKPTGKSSSTAKSTAKSSPTNKTSKTAKSSPTNKTAKSSPTNKTSKTSKSSPTSKTSKTAKSSPTSKTSSTAGSGPSSPSASSTTSGQLPGNGEC